MTGRKSKTVEKINPSDKREKKHWENCVRARQDTRRFSALEMCRLYGKYNDSRERERERVLLLLCEAIKFIFILLFETSCLVTSNLIYHYSKLFSMPKVNEL